MSLTVSMPAHAREIAPLLVSSPIDGCGTGVVQRMMCGTGNGLCYGDNLFLEVLSTLDRAGEAVQYHAEHRETEARRLEQVLAGQTDNYMVDLAPAFDGYISALFSMVYNLPHYAQHYAREVGRPVWGMVLAAQSVQRLHDLLYCFPMSRVIYVLRNPYDAVASQRYAQQSPGSNSPIVLAEQWATGVGAIRSLGEERVHVVRFEDLVNGTGTAALAAFAGLEGLDDSAARQSGVGEPGALAQAILSPEEIATVKSTVGDVGQEFYPDVTLG